MDKENTQYIWKHHKFDFRYHEFWCPKNSADNSPQLPILFYPKIKHFKILQETISPHSLFIISFLLKSTSSQAVSFLSWQVSLIARGKSLLFKCTLKWILKQFRALTFGRNLLIMKCRRIGSDYQNNETEHTSAKSIMYIAKMYY